MPAPRSGESEQDYVSRFMASAEALADYPDEKQRAAVAYSMFRERKNTFELCPSCGSSITINESAAVNDCAQCGHRMLGRQTPAIEDLDNICRGCRHQVAPEHDDFGCHIPGCDCTMTGAQAIDTIRRAVSNSREEAFVSRGSRNFGRLDMSSVGDSKSALFSRLVSMGAMTAEEAKTAQFDVSDKGYLVIISGQDFISLSLGYQPGTRGENSNAGPRLPSGWEVHAASEFKDSDGKKPSWAKSAFYVLDSSTNPVGEGATRAAAIADAYAHRLPGQDWGERGNATEKSCPRGGAHEWVGSGAEKYCDKCGTYFKDLEAEGRENASSPEQLKRQIEEWMIRARNPDLSQAERDQARTIQGNLQDQLDAAMSGRRAPVDTTAERGNASAFAVGRRVRHRRDASLIGTVESVKPHESGQDTVVVDWDRSEKLPHGSISPEDPADLELVNAARVPQSADEYAAEVSRLEAEGMPTSDAQAAVDAMMKKAGVDRNFGNSAHPAMEAFEAHVKGCEPCGNAYGSADPNPEMLCADGHQLLTAGNLENNVDVGSYRGFKLLQVTSTTFVAVDEHGAIFCKAFSPEGCKAEIDLHYDKVDEKKNARVSPGADIWRAYDRTRRVELIRQASAGDDSLADSEWEALPPAVQKQLTRTLGFENVQVPGEHLSKDKADLEEIARHAEGIEHEVEEMVSEDAPLSNAGYKVKALCAECAKKAGPDAKPTGKMAGAGIEACDVCGANGELTMVELANAADRCGCGHSKANHDNNGLGDSTACLQCGFDDGGCKAFKAELGNAGRTTNDGKTIDEVSRELTGKAYRELPDDGAAQDEVMREFEKRGGVAQQAFQNADSAPAGMKVVEQYEDEAKAKAHAKLIPGARVEKNPSGDAWRVLAPSERPNADPKADQLARIKHLIAQRAPGEKVMLYVGGSYKTMTKEEAERLDPSTISSVEVPQGENANAGFATSFQREAAGAARYGSRA